MKTLLIIIFSFTIGLIYAGIRMTDDAKVANELLKIKRFSDGSVFFIPKDYNQPYRIGGMFIETPDGMLIRQADEKYVVIDDIKYK